ncbi:MAG: hypothetical protein KTR31_06995 [Myxococcales bacterium]|nr:hypothetical protein [Myxococcales bacterium]
MRCTLLLALAACVPGQPVAGDDPAIDTPTPPAPTEETGQTPPLPEGTASCRRSGSNPLVVLCDVELTSEGDATLTLTAEGAPVRTFHSSRPGLAHELTGWGLKADTDYGWEVAGASGTVTTGELPQVLQTVQITTSGELFGTDAVMVYVSCGWFIMVDGDGDIVWGAPTDVYDGISDGMMWSQADRSVLAVRGSVMGTGPSALVETDLLGNEALTLEADTHFSLRLTHDVGRWGPYTYLLGEASGIGGFEVWEGTTHRGTYLLSDDFDSVDNLGVAHVNGLSVSEEGEVVVSVFAFDGVVVVDGDPDSPTFLDLLWHAAGDPGGANDLPDPDYVPAQGTLFQRQHNASLHDGQLWVFDNRSQSDPRALRMSIDESTGTLSEDDSWSVDRACPNQGGAMPIEGGVLATCANTRDVYAFRDGADVADFSLKASCPGQGGFGFNGSTRAYPVTIE